MTHDPATVQTVARAMYDEDDWHDDVTWDNAPRPTRRLYVARAGTALSAPPVAAAFAALAEVRALDDRWQDVANREFDRAQNSDDSDYLTGYCHGINDARADLRAALPTPTTEETTHA